MEQTHFVSQGFKELTDEECAATLVVRGTGNTIVCKVGEIYYAGKLGRKPALDASGKQRINTNNEPLWSYAFTGIRKGESPKDIDLPWSLFSSFMKGRNEFYSRTRFGRDILEAANDYERKKLITDHTFKVVFAEKASFKKFGSDEYEEKTAYLLEYAD